MNLSPDAESSSNPSGEEVCDLQFSSDTWDLDGEAGVGIPGLALFFDMPMF